MGIGGLLKARVTDTGWSPRLLWSWCKTWGSLPVIDWVAAAELFKKSQWQRACERYTRGLEKHSSNRAASCARYDRAFCLLQMRDLIGALADLRILTERRVGLREAYLLAARIEMQLGRSDSAAATLRLGLEIFPNDVGMTVLLAYAVMSSACSMEDRVEAGVMLQVLRSHVDIDSPMSSEVDCAIAWFELFYGDREYGERVLSRVLAAGDAPIEAVLLRAELWIDERRIGPAREQLQRALRLSPHDARVPLLLAKSYLVDRESGEATFAVPFAEQACCLSHWENVECLKVLAEAYEAVEDADATELVLARVQTVSSVRQLNFESVLEATDQIQRLRSAKIQVS